MTERYLGCACCGYRHRFQFPNGSDPQQATYAACCNTLLAKNEELKAELTEAKQFQEEYKHCPCGVCAGLRYDSGLSDLDPESTKE